MAARMSFCTSVLFAIVSGDNAEGRHIGTRMMSSYPVASSGSSGKGTNSSVELTKHLNPLTRGVTTNEGMMKFSHSISTDGYSVTLVCTSRTVRGRKHTFKSGVSTRRRKNNKKDAVPLAFRQEFPLLTADTVPEIMKFLNDIGCNNTDEFAAGDPGKGVLYSVN